MIRSTLVSLALGAAVVALAFTPACGNKSTGGDGVKDDPAASKAAFAAMGPVLQHPRCVNCHPAGDSPLQGDDMVAHQPPVVRGEGGMGAVGMRCSTCHGEKNVPLTENAGTMPGTPAWHLAPASMAWQGMSLAQICEQLKDNARNGGMTLDQVHEHVANDALVGWGWSPGARTSSPAPGTQVEFANNTRTWIDTGAHCPEG